VRVGIHKSGRDSRFVGLELPVVYLKSLRDPTMVERDRIATQDGEVNVRQCAAPLAVSSLDCSEASFNRAVHRSPSSGTTPASIASAALRRHPCGSDDGGA
jgi:hypothetical protein